MSIKIPDSITSISMLAFTGCTSLTSITIPISVANIGALAFTYYENLTIYTEWDAKPSGWSVMWNIMGSIVFCGCTDLDSISI